MHQTFFTPGPSGLFYTVEGHLKNAFKEHVMSISHRSQAYQAIHQETVDNIKLLLNLPDSYEVFFTGSANEIWERQIQNCVEHTSFHLVNGSFSSRFEKVAKELGKNVLKATANDGECVGINNLVIPEEVELIAATQNETSTGAAQPMEDIYSLKEQHPDKLLSLDVVSSLPYISIDFNKIDTAYFSVQKGFGLPAGLGVWIVNQKCIEKSRKLTEKGFSTGSYHSFQSFLSKSGKHQTPETPNVLGIYLLGKVIGDMLTKGLVQIQRETEYKAAIMYNMVHAHELLSPFVENRDNQSKTVIVINTGTESSKILKAAAEKGMIMGSGYGNYKNDHIRVANFPTHSKEQFEQLVDFLEAYSE